MLAHPKRFCAFSPQREITEIVVQIFSDILTSEHHFTCRNNKISVN